MPVTSKYLLAVSMDVDRQREALFNEVYRTEHIPELLKVPGVLSVVRFKRRELKMIIGGKLEAFPYESEPAYSALYELQSPDVLRSQSWAEAVERGRWPSEVRPYTTNRRHLLYEVLEPRQT